MKVQIVLMSCITLLLASCIQITQVATHDRHSTPLECTRVNTPFSIDIPPLWGVERD